jgi:hypothetical protein
MSCPGGGDSAFDVDISFPGCDQVCLMGANLVEVYCIQCFLVWLVEVLYEPGGVCLVISSIKNIHQLSAASTCFGRLYIHLSLKTSCKSSSSFILTHLGLTLRWGCEEAIMEGHLATGLVGLLSACLGGAVFVEMYMIQSGSSLTTLIQPV